MRTFPFLALALSSNLLWAQFDEPMRQHDAHVHGEARGHLSIDATSLQMTLEIPAFNLIGFEHPPADAAQRELLDGVMSNLESIAWIATDPAAGCTATSVDIDTPGLVAEAQHDDHDHDAHDDDHDHDHAQGDSHDHHDHGHNHDGDSHDHHESDPDHNHHEHDDHHHDDDHNHDHDHGSFEVTLTFDCARTTVLRWIDVDLFSDYDNNRLIRLDVLSDALVTQVDLVPGRFRVDLAR